MHTILTNYLAREILKTSLATLLVLYVILLSNSLGRVLADVADGDIPQQALWPVMLGQSVNLLSLLLPICLFLGIVFTFGRMYKDHEIVVMNACGVGYREFYRPVFVATLPFLLLSLFTSLWLSAYTFRLGQSAIERESNIHEFQLIKPGQFNQSGDGSTVFYMGSISDDRSELYDIILSQSTEEAMILETADSGRQEIEDRSGDLFLVIGPGQRVEGQAGDQRMQIMEYEQHGILIKRRDRGAGFDIQPEQMSLVELWSSQVLEHHVELHWRIAIPMTVIMLALLAVPLSYIAPRQGRYGKVGLALLALIAYLNLMGLTRAQMEEGVIPTLLNFWWVHLFFLLLTLVLIYRRNRGLLHRVSRA